jgi:hypothetical protein
MAAVQSSLIIKQVQEIYVTICHLFVRLHRACPSFCSSVKFCTTLSKSQITFLFHPKAAGFSPDDAKEIYQLNITVFVSDVEASELSMMESATYARYQRIMSMAVSQPPNQYSLDGYNQKEGEPGQALRSYWNF